MAGASRSAAAAAAGRRWARLERFGLFIVIGILFLLPMVIPAFRPMDWFVARIVRPVFGFVLRPPGCEREPSPLRWMAKRGRSSAAGAGAAPEGGHPQISILALVDQFLAVIEGARAVRLELHAEWLVMAAWLAWLKSRLLLARGGARPGGGPAGRRPAPDRPAGRAGADARGGAVARRPRQLGGKPSPAGRPESLRVEDRSGLSLDLTRSPAGLRGGAAARRGAPALLAQAAQAVVGGEALARLQSLIGGAGPSWSTLAAFLPDGMETPLDRKAALASTLVAALEAARGRRHRAAAGRRLRADHDPPGRGAWLISTTPCASPRR
jgi:segregation and condensation protein A